MPSFRTAEDTTPWIQFRQPVVQPIHESRPDLEIIFDLATRLGLGTYFFDGNIEAAVNYQLAPSGLTVQQLRAHPVGRRAAARTRHQKYAEIDAQTGQPRGFQTPTRKVEIYATRFASAGYAPLPMYQEPDASSAGHPQVAQAYPLVLTFFRVVQFCDEQHRHSSRLRRQVSHPFLEIHPTTAGSLDMHDGEWVIVETMAGRVRLRAKCNAFLHPHVVATQHGWWQGC